MRSSYLSRLVAAGLSVLLLINCYGETAPEAPSPDLVLGNFTDGTFEITPRDFLEDPVTGKLFAADSQRILRFASGARYLTGAPPEAEFRFIVPATPPSVTPVQ